MAVPKSLALLEELLAGKRVLIIEPAFSEYEKACQVNDCQITYFQSGGRMEDRS